MKNGNGSLSHLVSTKGRTGGNEAKWFVSDYAETRNTSKNFMDPFYDSTLKRIIFLCPFFLPPNNKALFKSITFEKSHDNLDYL